MNDFTKKSPIKWYSTDEFLPGNNVGYVIARVLNADFCQFIYQAIHTRDGWEFWDEEFWPEDCKRKEEIKVTHWAYMPEFHDGGF